MEAEAQKLQDALGPNIPVYLGSEWLSRQPELPHVVVIPGNVEYRPPAAAGQFTLADATVGTTVLCKATLFEEALALADACYAALTPGRAASVRLGSEVWGDYTVRTAALSISQDASVTRDYVERIRVQTFTQVADITPISTTEEVPNDETETSIRGETQFRD